MNDLVYPKERSLGKITLVLGVLVWLALIVGTFGGALIAIAASFVVFLFIHSTLISHIKGNGVELTEEQYPELYAEFVACCDRLQMEKRPKAYILNGNGGLNAFATKFLGTKYVVLLSDVVDAMSEKADGLRFYIGHELGHLRMKHLSGQLFRWPVLWLPLLGAAYSRARESTCDRHGLACSESPEAAAQALSALSAGPRLWKDIDLPAYRKQVNYSSGFWMSFHELTAAYPWLSKRVARVTEPDAGMPRRNPFAYLLALFVPYAGRLGGTFGLLIMIYIIGVMAAIAIPAYHSYVVKTELTNAMLQTNNVRQSLGDYYAQNGKIPTLADINIAKSQYEAAGTELALDHKGMVLSVTTKHGKLYFVPSADKQGQITWECITGRSVKPGQAPATCHPPQSR